MNKILKWMIFILMFDKFRLTHIPYKNKWNITVYRVCFYYTRKHTHTNIYIYIYIYIYIKFGEFLKIHIPNQKKRNMNVSGACIYSPWSHTHTHTHTHTHYDSWQSGDIATVLCHKPMYKNQLMTSLFCSCSWVDSEKIFAKKWNNQE